MTTIDDFSRVLAAMMFGLTALATADQGLARPPDWHAVLDTADLDTGAPGTRAPLAEPGPDEAMARALVTHARNERRLQALGGALPDARSVDVDVDGDGVLDLAVVVDNGGILIPAVSANPLDLQPGTLIRYRPSGADGFAVELATGAGLDPTLGGDLGLGDDDATEVALSAAFPFLGTSYDSIFVGSDGHITLGAADGSSTARDAARHIGGPPRLSALLTDLNPACPAGVHADARADRVVVTWNQVPHFARGCGAGVPTSTIQAVLHGDGTIEFVFGELDAAVIGQSATAVTGVAEGNSQGPLNEIDMTRPPAGGLQAGAIFEQFSPASAETFSLVQIAREFYRSHEDLYDYLVVFMDFEIFGGGSAFHAGIQNRTLGLGRGFFDFTGLLGSAGELESFLWMNNINLWGGHDAESYTDPTVHRFAVTTSPRLTAFLGGNLTPTTAPYELFGMLDITGDTGFGNGYSHHGRVFTFESPNTDARATRGAVRYDLNSTASVMFQEADHRWGAFAGFLHPTKGTSFDRLDLLGRSFAHWSTFFNTRVAGSPFTQADGMPRFSGMEGNALIELALGGGGQIVDKNDPGRVIADPDGKLAAGLAFCDLQGKGLFLTEPEELIDGATELDQYLMGVRRAAEVSPFWYVDEPSSALTGASLDEPSGATFIRGSTFNVDDIAYCGIRVDLTIDDVTSLGDALVPPNPVFGPRVPAIGDENDLGPLDDCLGDPAPGPCADVKTMAWILVVRDGPPTAAAHQPSIRRLNELRKAWQAYTDGPGLGGRNADGVVRAPDDPGFIAKFDTSLEPAIH